MRNLLLSAATVLMAGTAYAVPAQSAQLPAGAAHNIVLVHGAFVDQTSWKPVADILTKKGYNVTLVKNPLTSLGADVDATKQALAQQDGRTVLVGDRLGEYRVKAISQRNVTLEKADGSQKKLGLDK